MVTGFIDQTEINPLALDLEYSLEKMYEGTSERTEYFKNGKKEARETYSSDLKYVEKSAGEKCPYEQKDFSGDENKLIALYEKYYHVLLYVAVGYLKDHQLAEDMVQETFIKVANRLSAVQEVTSKMTKYFLITIVRNKCIDYIRKMKRMPETVLEDWELYIESCDPPLEQVVRQETLRELNSMIDHLEDSYRIPLKLRYMEGLSNQEIAEITHMSANLVAVRINRAKKMLREMLNSRISYLY